MLKKEIKVIGYASCDGAQDHGCNTGPIALQKLHLSQKLAQADFDVEWTGNIFSDHTPDSALDTFNVVRDNCKELAKQTRNAIDAKKQIIVIGGDHSCAIGTWSGVYNALPEKSQLGLIWIDAHMDSHTTETSTSGAIHGMPVATLLGFGHEELCSIESKDDKILPKNLCLVGIRSFEPAEAKLLNDLGVKIFYMKDIIELGLLNVIKLAQKHICTNATHYGISLDLDAIDPNDAPGVGSPENGGISGEKLISALQECNFTKNFIGIEVTELNPNRDYVDKTAKLAIEAILACLTTSATRETA